MKCIIYASSKRIDERLVNLIDGKATKIELLGLQFSLNVRLLLSFVDLNLISIVQNADNMLVFRLYNLDVLFQFVSFFSRELYI